ncbi:MBL fold metallo-hydrolase [Ilumatobacter sp.]|uniref:MBL fold metallo-hydrolase n=1 Tax=Ilumatobacter sp. TaxID=1967498 RepID=UPI003B52DF84
MTRPGELVIDLGVRARDAPRGRITFIGTATVLVEIGPFTFLTDPNFLHAGDHAPLGYGLRSRRLTSPAVELDQLPELDFVVLSHHHGDHFDPVVVERLAKSTRIVTEPGSARKLRRQRFEQVIALDTWQAVTFRRGGTDLRVTAMPGRHAPGPLRWALPGVMGSILDYVVDGRLAHRTYVTGDTLMFEGLVDVVDRYPDVDACLLHLGGTRIAGVLLTMDAEQGIRFVEMTRPREVLPIHYDDYTVFRSPIADFLERFAEVDATSRLTVMERGVPHPFGPEPDVVIAD